MFHVEHFVGTVMYVQIWGYLEKAICLVGLSGKREGARVWSSFAEIFNVAAVRAEVFGCAPYASDQPRLLRQLIGCPSCDSVGSHATNNRTNVCTSLSSSKSPKPPPHRFLVNPLVT